VKARQELMRACATPLKLGSFIEMLDDFTALVTSSSGLSQQMLVRVLSTLDREKLKPNTTVALHKSTNAVVKIMPNETDAQIQMMQVSEKPDVSYQDVGGLDQ
jgi:26S proteasome regulatory subunit T3